jgi:hypothetical protein
MGCTCCAAPVATTCTLVGGSCIWPIVCNSSLNGFHKIPPYPSDCNDFDAACVEDGCSEVEVNTEERSYSWSTGITFGPCYCYYSCVTQYIVDVHECVPKHPNPCTTTSTSPPPTTPPPPPPGDCESGGTS